jgi:hypothetical protein
MSWEWVASIATAAVGIAGLCSTVWVARQGRQHAEHLTAEATKKTLDLARETRSQERIEIAYRRILEVATETNSFVTETDVVWSRDAKPHDCDEVAYEIVILLAVYASNDMRESYDTWRASIERLRDLLEKVPQKKSWYECKDIADEFRKESESVHESLSCLYEVARRELI